MKRTEIMAHAMENLGSPLYKDMESLDTIYDNPYKEKLGPFYTDQLCEYFYPVQCPIHVLDYFGEYSKSFDTFEELEEALPNTKLYPDKDLYQSDGLHFRLEEYREGKF